MIEFKQKEYGDKLQTIGLGISGAALAVSAANLYNNREKRKSDVKFQKDQIRSTDALTKALNENSAITKKNMESNESFYNDARSGKVRYYDPSAYNYINPHQEQQQSQIKKKKKFKLFSIQSGGFRRGMLTNKNPLTSKYSSDGIDFSSSMAVSCFLKELARKTPYYCPADRELIEVTPGNNNPLSYPVNLVITGNVMSIAMINPRPEDLSKLNTVLDRYCQEYCGADYSTEVIQGGNIYIIEVNLIGGSDLYNKMISSGLQINVL